MTERRRPAPAARVLLAAGSAATTLGLVAAMGSAPSPAAPPSTAELRVVITDPRIDPGVAVAAARAGAREGVDVVTVPVAAAPAPAPNGGTDVPHTITASS